MTSSPPKNPKKGERTIGMMTLPMTPPASHQWPPAALYQMIESQFPWVAARAAPITPPTSAWLDEEGSPNHHVIRFQMIAPTSALITNWDMIDFGTTASEIKPD